MRSTDERPILFFPIKALSKTSNLRAPDGSVIANLKDSYHSGFVLLCFTFVSWTSFWNDKVTEGLQSLIRLSPIKSFASMTATYNFD